MSTATAVRAFAIDKTHSEAAFQVRHLITKVRGRFADFAGTIQFDAEQPARSSVSFTIQAASIDTATPDRDAHLNKRGIRNVVEWSKTRRGGQMVDWIKVHEVPRACESAYGLCE